MSRTRKDADYGTDNPRAFAHFVAGLFAQRTGQLKAAQKFYALALGLDPRYHKALNNGGLLVLAGGGQAYVASRAEEAGRLFRDADRMFRQAIAVDNDVAEYFYNLGTVLSYRGRLALARDAGGRDDALALQHRSIDAYRSALERLAKEPELGPEPRRPSVLRPGARREHQRRLQKRVERLAFLAAVEVALATSWALVRALRGSPEPLPGESSALERFHGIRRQDSTLASHPRLDYNLGCYYVASGQQSLAVELFETLRAVDPEVAARALADPDLADAAAIRLLFSPAPSPKPEEPPFY